MYKAIFSEANRAELIGLADSSEKVMEKHGIAIVEPLVVAIRNVLAQIDSYQKELKQLKKDAECAELFADEITCYNGEVHPREERHGDKCIWCYIKQLRIELNVRRMEATENFRDKVLAAKDEEIEILNSIISERVSNEGSIR